MKMARVALFIFLCKVMAESFFVGNNKFAVKVLFH